MASTPALETNARCPRCGEGFACQADAGYCDCFELKLSEALRRQLAQDYANCLCLRCLRELQAQETSERQAPSKLGAPLRQPR